MDFYRSRHPSCDKKPFALDMLGKFSAPGGGVAVIIPAMTMKMNRVTAIAMMVVMMTSMTMSVAPKREP
jgi:hypothetical protein